MTWSEYQRACLGYKIRMDRGWDYVRNLMASNIAPFSKKTVNAKELYRCIFDTDTIPVTPEEFEKIRKAWKLN